MDCNDIQDVYAQRRNKKKRDKRKEISENSDAQEDIGLHYDPYHGWIKDDK